MKQQVLRFTDACYALDTDEEGWLAELAVSARPFIDCGLDVAAWGFTRDDWTGTRLPIGVEPSIGSAMWKAAARYSPSELQQLFMGGRATPATMRLNLGCGLDQHHAGDHFGPLGIKDFNALTVFDGAGRGVALAGASERILSPNSSQLARLERLGAHLLAGYRLRRELRRIDAVLEPDGSSVHAEGEARDPEHQESLVRAVRAFDRMRSQRGSASADEALQAFEGLVAGRWSVVQTFESDGRRYLVAIHNPPGKLQTLPLTPNQCHGLLLRAQGLAYKMIGYEMGVSELMAFSLVEEGMQKLGVARDSDLPLFFRAQLESLLGAGGSSG